MKVRHILYATLLSVVAMAVVILVDTHVLHHEIEGAHDLLPCPFACAVIAVFGVLTFAGTMLLLKSNAELRRESEDTALANARLLEREQALASANAELSGKQEKLESSEASVRWLSEKLVVLNEITIRLGEIRHFDDLCRTAVEFGRSRLGFARMSMWFISDDRTGIRGSFGVDENGVLRDERESFVPVDYESLVRDVVSTDDPVRIYRDASLENDDAREVGRGDKMVAGIFDENRIIGYVFTDNLLSGQPISDRETKLFMLFASSIGQLCVRARSYEALELTKFSVDRSSDAVIWIHRNGHITYANNALSILLGYSLDELQDMSVWDIDMAMNKESWPAAWDRLKERESVFRQAEFRTSDGGQVPVEIVANYISYAGKEYNCVFVRNISDRIEAEAALQDSEKRYRSLAESSSDMIFIVNREGMVEYVNNASAAAMSREVESIEGRPLKDLFPAEIYERQWLAIKNVMETGERFHREDETVFPEFGRVWLDTVLTPLLSQSGTIDRVLGISRNIGERKLAEEALRESEQRYRSLVESVTDYIYTAEIGDGKIISLSHGAGCIGVTGYSSEELSADPELWERIIRSEDLTLVHRRRGAFLAGNPVGPLEYRIKHKSGALRWLRDSVVPYFDADGNVVSFDGMVSNITERKNAQEELERSEQRFRLTFENARDAIVWANPKTGLIVNCNRAAEELFGRSRKDLILKHHTILHPPDNPEQYEEFFREHASMGGVSGMETTAIHASGRIIPVAVSVSITSVGDQDVMQGIFRDITEEKLAREALERDARQLDVLYRVISAVNRATDLEQLLNLLLNEVLGIMEFDGGGIYLVSEHERCADLLCQKGLVDGFVDSVRCISIDDEAYRRVFVDGRPLVTDNYSSLNAERARLGGIESLVSIPMVARDRVVGAMNLASREKRKVPDEELDTLFSVARQIGTAIAKMQSETRLRESEEKYRTITEQSLVGIFVMKDRRIVFVNEGFAGILGYTQSEMMAWTEDDLEATVHPGDRALFGEHVFKLPPATGGGDGPVHDYRFMARDGTIKWILLHFKSLRIGGERVFSGMAVDISKRKRMEQALADTNRQLRERTEELFGAVEQLKAQEQDLIGANVEKEVLLREIHHRVKNNFQVISSLLHLQLKRTADDVATEIIRDCLNRIKSMAIVHEKLYRSKNLAEIDLAEYARSLSSHLGRVYLLDQRDVSVDISGENVSLSLDRAIPCCLILNELISNSLKHAFPSDREGKITVTCGLNADDMVVVQVRDNGVGLPDDLDPGKAGSLGLQLVKTFVDQLEGSLEHGNDGGAMFRLEFARTDGH